MTNDTIQKILEELYQLDPAFRGHEDRLKHILQELIATKPNVTINEEFAKDLRHRLVVHGRTLGELEHSSKGIGMKKYTFALASLAVVVIAILGITSYTSKNGNLLTSKSVMDEAGSFLAGESKISKLQPQAFGSLGGLSFASGQGGDLGSPEGISAQPASDASRSKVGAGGSGASEPGIIAPYYIPVSYQFKYTGDAFTIPFSQMDVYKRIRYSDNGSGLLSRLSSGLLNLNKFTNQQMDSLTFAEDKDYGYMVNINFREGMVSIHENWLKWPQPGKDCRDEACYRNLQLKPDQVPNDQALIDMTNSFLNEYGIDTNQYGTPQVQNFWRQELLRIKDPAHIYVPDVISVVYPVKIEDKTVYDEGGMESGLVVNVNIRANKVSGLYDLTNRSFEASGYEAEINTAKLISLAERGSFRSYPIYADPNTKTEVIELGTPTISFARLWKYDQNQSQELYVPALVFPVIKNSTIQPYYQKNVVIPIIKDILNQPEPPFQILEKPMPVDIGETKPTE